MLKGVDYMKKMHTGLIVAVIASVFFISFLVGRAAVLKEKEKEENKITYGGFVPIPESEEESIETTGEAEKIPDRTPKKKTIEEMIAVPQRMLFPCGENVVKEYSQTAVYSETMGDWRAHTGIDYGANPGDEVVSAWKGTVRCVYADKLWGNTVEISHSQDLVSVYKNLDENILVEKGQAVQEGQVIGYIGNSATVESLEKPHLHFEMLYEGVKINPESYVY